jgi:hypothetical protein
MKYNDLARGIDQTSTNCCCATTRTCKCAHRFDVPVEDVNTVVVLTVREVADQLGVALR